MIFRIGMAMFFLQVTSACSTQILRPELMDKTTASPQFEDYYDRWVFGLIGDVKVDPEVACVDQIPVKYREYTSLEDVMLGLISLGFYLPETVQVWCVSN